jgi:hypothetical protein
LVKKTRQRCQTWALETPDKAPRGLAPKQWPHQGESARSSSSCSRLLWRLLTKRPPRRLAPNSGHNIVDNNERALLILLLALALGGMPGGRPATQAGAAPTGAAPKSFPRGCGVEFVKEMVWDARVPAELRAQFGARGQPAREQPPCRKVKVAPIPCEAAHPAAGQFGLFAAQTLSPGEHVLDYLGFVTTEEHCNVDSQYVASLCVRVCLCVCARARVCMCVRAPPRDQVATARALRRQ